MTKLEPIVRRKLVFLVLMRLLEDASELFAYFGESVVSDNVIELEALPDLPVASRAEVERASIRLLQMVDPHHEALVQGAVTESKHVTEFVSGKLDDSHKCLTLELLFCVILFFGPFGHKAMDTVHTTVSIAVAEAEVAQVLCEKINIGQADDSKGVGVRSLDRSDELLKNVDCVVLRVVEVVFLCVDAQATDFVVCHRIKNHNFARHVECFHPFAELVKLFLRN